MKKYKERTLRYLTCLFESVYAARPVMVSARNVPIMVIPMEMIYPFTTLEPS
jgi:hypothetical protein